VTKIPCTVGLKHDFVFQRKGPVHSKQRGCQVSQAVAGELCTSLFIHGSNTGQAVIFCLFSLAGYPLHSTVSPTLPLTCITVCHQVSILLYIGVNCVYHIFSVFFWFYFVSLYIWLYLLCASVSFCKLCILTVMLHFLLLCIFTFADTIFRCVILTNLLYTYRQNTTVVLDVVYLFISPSLHVSAYVRPSSGSLEVYCPVHCFLTFYPYIYTINYTAVTDLLY
jgi:hypothetical protein